MALINMSSNPCRDLYPSAKRSRHRGLPPIWRVRHRESSTRQRTDRQ